MDENDPDFLSQYRYVKYTGFSTSLLSLISIVVVFYAFISRPSLRNFSFRLIIYLQSADAIMALCMFLQIGDPIYHERLCLAQAFIGNFGCLSSFLWTCCISSAIYFSCTGKWMDVEKKEKVFLIICNVIPLIISVIPFFFDAYGVAGHWCWVKMRDIPEKFRNSLIIFILFIYLWIAILYNSLMIFLTVRFFRSKENQVLLSLYDKKLKKTLMFPIIMVVLWTVPSVYRLFQMFDIEIFALSIIHVICEGVNGLVNTIFYVWSKKFKNELRKSIRLPGEELLINQI